MPNGQLLQKLGEDFYKYLVIGVLQTGWQDTNERNKRKSQKRYYQG